MKKVSSYCGSWEFPSGRKQERRADVGQEIDHRQVETDAEIRCPEIQPVSALRQAARFLPEVPAVPDLPEAARPSRRASRRDQGELVGRGEYDNGAQRSRVGSAGAVAE